MNDKLTIYVNTYYDLPERLRQILKNSKGLYVPVNSGNLKGREGCEGMVFETDFEDNIARMNSRLNELTAIYAVWKNMKLPDYVGHNHYRRLFAPEDLLDFEKFDIIVQNPIEMLFLVKKPGVDVPKSRNDVMAQSCTVEKGYDVCHAAKDFMMMERAVKATDTPYSRIFDEWKSLRFLYAPCQMFVMRKGLFDDYCQFVFSILFALDGKIDLEGRDGYQKRAYAFLGERLFSLWAYAKSKQPMMKVKQIETVFIPEFKPDNATDLRGFYGK